MLDIKAFLRSTAWAKEINDKAQKYSKSDGSHIYFWSAIYLIVVATLTGLIYTLLATAVPYLRDHMFLVWFIFFITTPYSMRLTRKVTPYIVTVVDDFIADILSEMLVNDDKQGKLLSDDYILRLKGPKNLVIPLGKDYEDPGFEAFEKSTGKDIADRVRQTSNVYPWRHGKYSVTYSVEFDDGSRLEAKRYVSSAVEVIKEEGDQNGKVPK